MGRQHLDFLFLVLETAVILQPAKELDGEFTSLQLRDQYRRHPFGVGRDTPAGLYGPGSSLIQWMAAGRKTAFMKRLFLISLTLATCCCLSPEGWTQASDESTSLWFRLGHPRPGYALSGAEDARPIVPPADNFFHEYLRRSAERAFSGGDLLIYAEHLYGLERYTVSPINVLMEGVGAGATIGLFMGAAGSTVGLWDEKSSWYLVGAAAAVGAFLNARDANDPRKRLRYRWSGDLDGTRP